MKWTGSKYIRGRPLEETLSLIRAELEAFEDLEFELKFEEAPNVHTGGLMIVEVLQPYGDRQVMAKVSHLVNDYTYSHNDPANDIWDMGFNVRVRPKPPMTA